METEHTQPTPDILYDLVETLLRNPDSNLEKSIYTLVQQLKLVDSTNYASILIEKIQVARQSGVISEDLSLELLDTVRNA